MAFKYEMHTKITPCKRSEGNKKTAAKRRQNILTYGGTDTQKP